jgi:LmbE family N-acetylglucosaminyl deacetylase
VKVLAIGAHPDDVEILCAGTLKRLHDRGHAIAIATVTNGSCGSATLSAEEIAVVRKKEAAEAARIIDAEYHCADLCDLEIVFDNDTRRLVSELFRVVQPEIVITHYPQDYIYDHDMTSMLARDATFSATLGNYSTGAADPAPLLPHVPYLYYMSPIDGVTPFGAAVEYQFIVDITDAIETKAEMLACHESQREWLRAQHDMDEYIEYMRRDSARIGAISGYAYGEGFQQHLGHPYKRDNIILDLLT